jgi:NhaP-type Na+/H+ or K+/H+ antiporter
MERPSDSIFSKEVEPVKQVLIVLGLSLGFMVFNKSLELMGVFDEDPKGYWTLAATFILFFAIFNSLFSLTTKNMDKYWTRSMLSFVGLAGVTGVGAYFFSGIAMEEAGSYKWIYIVLTIGYLIFLSIMGAMRSIVDFAQKEEWNHPRIRKKGRKDKNR